MKKFEPKVDASICLNEAFLSTILDIAHDAIIVIDHRQRIILFNQGAEQIFKYDRSEVLGRPLHMLLPEHLAQIHRDHVRQFANSGDSSRQMGQRRKELFGRRKNGSIFPAQASIAKVHQDGRVAFLVILQDISKRRQLEAENERLIAQFYQAQKMESIGSLAGGIAHDLNNLLVPIIGYAERSLRLIPSNNKLQSNLSEIGKAANRAADLTRQILAFARQQVLEMKTLDLNQLILTIEPMLRRLIPENITLKIRLMENRAFIRADKVKLEQVLLNLVVNARDAMPDGGTLAIETDQVELDESYTVHHLPAEPGTYVRLIVSDTGVGMSPATQKRIFEPFFTTKPRGKGTGLGMATVFGIVKQHEGNIWVYSELNKGTTFKIYLPVSGELVATSESEKRESGSFEGSETVLLVEDNESVRHLVNEVLSEHGYLVLAASDPEEGLALANSHRGSLHLLLTDVILPVMNGRELYEKISSMHPQIGVLYISGHTDSIITHHGVLKEEVVFLQKPFTISELLYKVREALE